MSGIVGSSHNIRGSGVVAKLGTDGQVFTSAGAGIKQTFEAAAGGGKVLQVVQVYKQDKFTTASTSYVDVTGLTVDITCAATSSKVLVLVSINMGCANWHSAKLVRDSTDIAIGSGASGAQVNQTISGHGANSAYGQNGYAPMYLDSPSSTSALTYKIVAKCHAGGEPLAIGQSAGDYNDDDTGSTPQTITCIEIGA